MIQDVSAAIGRLLAEPHGPDALPPGTKFYGKPIPGEHLFGDHIDLWICSLVIDGKLGTTATLDDLRALVEAHWARGYQLVKDELDTCSGDEAKLVARLADFVPDGETPEPSTTTSVNGSIGGIKLKVGSASVFDTHKLFPPVSIRTRLFIYFGQGFCDFYFSLI